MFAYCGNNPISRLDMGGAKRTYIIEETETEILEESDSGIKYQTTIVFSNVKTNWLGKEKETQESTTATFIYYINNDGAITFDNTQDDAHHLKNATVRNRLVEEMYTNCVNNIANSLAKRTIAGISSELYWHYIFSFTGPGETANIGGRGKNVPGKDTNAWIFEWFTFN